MAVVDPQNITVHLAHHWNQLIQVCVDCLLNINSRLQNMWHCALWQWIRHVLVDLVLWQWIRHVLVVLALWQWIRDVLVVLALWQWIRRACGFSIVTVNQACACDFKDAFLTSAKSTQCVQCKYWDVLLLIVSDLVAFTVDCVVSRKMIQIWLLI